MINIKGLSASCVRDFETKAIKVTLNAWELN